MAKIIGIDLGTANSRVSVYEGNSPLLIMDLYGQSMTPSVLAYNYSDQWLIGNQALMQSGFNPENTFFAIKNLILDEHDVKVHGQHFSGDEMLSLLYEKLKKDANIYLGYNCQEVVLTYPSFFNFKQIQSLKLAAERCYLKVKRLITVTDAIALYQSHYRRPKEDRPYLIVDIGAGSTSSSIIFYDEEWFVEVKSTYGSPELSGNHITELLYNYFINKFKEENGISCNNDVENNLNIFRAAELAKIVLSDYSMHHVYVRNVAQTAKGQTFDMNFKISRAEFDKILEPQMDILEELLNHVFKSSGYLFKDVENVVLAGEGTRIPFFHTKLSTIFGKQLNVHRSAPDEVVLGAAIMGGVLTGEIKDLLLLPCSRASIGLMLRNRSFFKIIDQNTIRPSKKSASFKIDTTRGLSNFVEIHVFEGEGDSVDQNIFLGTLVIAVNFRELPADPELEVTIDLDINPEVKVIAKFHHMIKFWTICLPSVYKLPSSAVLKSNLYYD